MGGRDGGQDARWPLALSAAVIIGLSLMLWGLIAIAGRALIAAG